MESDDSISDGGRVNIVILEDEKVAARRLQRLVTEALGETLAEISVFTTLEEGLEHVESQPTDLLLLDLNLNGEDGFEVLTRVVENPFDTIVVSANTDRAIEAFELGVIDFIPKPFDKARLEKALNRFTGRMNRLKGTSTLVVKNQGRRQFIPVENVRYIRGAGDYAEIHCEDGTSALHSRSLEGMGKILSDQFIRIHKSYLVDRQRIAEVKVYGGGRYGALLHSGEELPVSRSRYKDLFGEG